MVARQFVAPLVGMRFRPPAEDVVYSLAGGTELRVEFQEDNPYDADALAVYLDGFEEGGSNEALFMQLRDFFEREGEGRKLELMVSPLMLGFVANSEKTGGKWATTIKSYMTLDGRRSVLAKLGFNAQALPQLEFNWNPEDEVSEEHKVVTSSPLEQVEKTGEQMMQEQLGSSRSKLDDDIPF